MDNVSSSRRLAVEIAKSIQQVEECQALRYEIFAEELGADLHSDIDGLDIDHYDEFCDHLIVRDLGSGEVVGCTRILNDRYSDEAGGFYSNSEFNLGNVNNLPGSTMEIGRTCVHQSYRNGATIGTLWQGLADYIAGHDYDFVFGCASIGMEDGGVQVHAIMNRMRRKYMVDDQYRVTPKTPVPQMAIPDNLDARLPPLLKAYLHLGAQVGGEPCWDPDFGCADLFMLLDIRNLSPRYAKHFLHRAQRRAG